MHREITVADLRNDQFFDDLSITTKWRLHKPPSILNRWPCTSICVLALSQTDREVQDLRRRVREELEKAVDCTHCSRVHLRSCWLMESFLYVILIPCVCTRTIESICARMEQIFAVVKLFHDDHGTAHALDRGLDWLFTEAPLHDPCPFTQRKGPYMIAHMTEQLSSALEMDVRNDIFAVSKHVILGIKIDSYYMECEHPDLVSTQDVIVHHGPDLQDVYRLSMHSVNKKMRTSILAHLLPLCHRYFCGITKEQEGRILSLVLQSWGGWFGSILQPSLRACNRDCFSLVIQDLEQFNHTRRQDWDYFCASIERQLHIEQSEVVATQTFSPTRPSVSCDFAASVMEQVLPCITNHLTVVDMMKLGNTCTLLRKAMDCTSLMRRLQIVIPQQPLIAPPSLRMQHFAQRGIINLQLSTVCLGPSHVDLLPLLFSLRLNSMQNVAQYTFSSLRSLHITDYTTQQCVVDLSTCPRLLELILCIPYTSVHTLVLPSSLRSVDVNLSNASNIQGSCTLHSLSITMTHVPDHVLHGFGLQCSLEQLTLRQGTNSGPVDNPPYVTKYCRVRNVIPMTPISCIYLSITWDTFTVDASIILPMMKSIRYLRVFFYNTASGIKVYDVKHHHPELEYVAIRAYPEELHMEAVETFCLHRTEPVVMQHGILTYCFQSKRLSPEAVAFCDF